MLQLQLQFAVLVTYLQIDGVVRSLFLFVCLLFFAIKLLQLEQKRHSPKYLAVFRVKYTYS